MSDPDFYSQPNAVELAESRALAVQLFYELSAALETLDVICKEVGTEWVLQKMPPRWRATMASRLGDMKDEVQSDDGGSTGDESEILPGGPGEGQKAPDCEADWG